MLRVFLGRPRDLTRAGVRVIARSYPHTSDVLYHSVVRRQEATIVGTLVGRSPSLSRWMGYIANDPPFPFHTHVRTASGEGYIAKEWPRPTIHTAVAYIYIAAVAETVLP